MQRLNPPFQPRGARYPRVVRIEVPAIAIDPTGLYVPTAINPAGDALFRWDAEKSVWEHMDHLYAPLNILDIWTQRTEGARIYRGIFTIRVRV